MDSESAHPIPHELQALVDIEIVMEAPLSATREQALQNSVGSRPGVETLQFLPGRIAIRYDPELINKAQLCELIHQEGCGFSEVECASASPGFDSHESSGNPTDLAPPACPSPPP